MILVGQACLPQRFSFQTIYRRISQDDMRKGALLPLPHSRFFILFPYVYLSLPLSLSLSLQVLFLTFTVMLDVSLLGLLSAGNRLAESVTVPAVVKSTSNFTLVSSPGARVIN